MNRVEKIKKIVCDYYSVNMEFISRKCRRREVLYPRQILTYLLMKHTKIGCVLVSKMVSQDHTTVLNSVHTIEDLLFADDTVQKDIQELRGLMGRSDSFIVSPYLYPGIAQVYKNKLKEI